MQSMKTDLKNLLCFSACKYSVTALLNWVSCNTALPSAVHSAVAACLPRGLKGALLSFLCWFVRNYSSLLHSLRYEIRGTAGNDTDLQNHGTAWNTIPLQSPDCPYLYKVFLMFNLVWIFKTLTACIYYISTCSYRLMFFFLSFHLVFSRIGF